MIARWHILYTVFVDQDGGLSAAALLDKYVYSPLVVPLPKRCRLAYRGIVVL
jgi:hypothetical protein